MGLPLFVAPVESDLNAKADKHLLYTNDRATQSRSAIRRSRRTDDRESRGARRRAAILNDMTSGNPSEPLLGRFHDANGRLTHSREIWVTSGQRVPFGSLPPPAPAPAPASAQIEDDDLIMGRAFRPVEEGGMGLRRVGVGQVRTPFEASALFTETEPEAFRRVLDRDRRRRREARLASRDSEEHDGDSRTYRRSNIAPSVAARFDRSPDPVTSTTATTAQNRESTRNRNQWSSRWRQSQEILGFDGLGDRNRSVSPEVWNTLLTTLTPDPQPPSAGSSFASATASTAATSQNQSAAASSRTSLAEHDRVVDGPAADQPCEPRDGSDDTGEEDDSLNMDLMPGSNSTVPSRFRRFISSLTPPEGQTSSSQNPADHPYSYRPTLPFNGRPDGVWRSLERVRARMQYLQETDPNFRPRAPSVSGGESGTEPQTGSGTTREGSEDASESLDQGDLEPAGSGSLDVALGGMQRIVRGLVERRDIPDEWWAEAGLSRLISDDA